MNKYNLTFTDVINKMNELKEGTIIKSENGNEYQLEENPVSHLKRFKRINNTTLRFMTYNNTKAMFKIVKNEEWIPKYGEEYWLYDKDVEKIRETSWCNDYYDKTRLKNKVIFKTEEEAQRYADYQKAKTEYSYEFSKEEWENCRIHKYCIYYNYLENELIIDDDFVARSMNKTYFKVLEKAEEFRDKYKSEILEFEFGIKE